MEEWNNNNLACLKTWIHLKVLNQHNKVFWDTGRLKMNQLTFWNQSSSSELISFAAKTICQQLDNMFRLFDKAVYEPRSSNKKAVEAMHKIMMNEKNTIGEFHLFAITNHYKD